MKDSASQPAPTLAHVAHRAGVSKSTASASLRDIDGPSEETKAKVRAAASELGYRVKVGARALRTGLNSTAAVILDPRTVDRELKVDTYWGRFINSLVTTCSAEQIPVMLVAAEDASVLEGQPVDAVLYMADYATSTQLGTFGFGLPLVRVAIDDSSDAAAVTTLRRRLDLCTREILEQFAEQGARHPVIVFGRERDRLFSIDDEAARWSAEKGIPVSVVEVDNAREPTLARAEIHKLLEAGHDAFLTMLIDPNHVVDAAAELGLTVPDDILLVAQTHWTRIADLPLSNVSFLGEVCGAIAGQALIDAIAGNPNPDLVLPYEIEFRKSSIRAS